MKNDLLEYRGCKGAVHFSAEDKIFFGRIEGINDLISYEGGTVKELKKAFIESVVYYIGLKNDVFQ